MRPAWLKEPEVEPFATAPFVVLAIKRTQPGQFHVGIVHRSQTASPKLLHLAWHEDLRDARPSTDYSWTPLPFERSVCRGLAGVCRKVAKWYTDGTPLPYGFDDHETSFDATTGMVRFGQDSSGLTCATFVLAVFRSQRYDLVRTENWPHRKDDEAWAAQVADALEADGASPEHVANVRKCTGTSVRVRPEELVGGVGFSANLPANLCPALRGAERVKRVLGR
jgi:hypothetical protein